MAAERIDVLAVMDKAAGGIWPYSFALSDEVREARAAVAELVAKADNAATALSNLIAARQADERYAGVVTDLTAALARVQGGQP